MACNVAYRKSAILNPGKFDPKFKETYEDIDLGIKLSYDFIIRSLLLKNLLLYL